MKELTQEQIKMMDRAIRIDRAIKCAPTRQLLMWWWWDVFCKRKADKVIKCLEVGMTWFAAYTIAKNVR